MVEVIFASSSVTECEQVFYRHTYSLNKTSNESDNTHHPCASLIKYFYFVSQSFVFDYYVCLHSYHGFH